MPELRGKLLGEGEGAPGPRGWPGQGRPRGSSPSLPQAGRMICSMEALEAHCPRSPLAALCRPWPLRGTGVARVLAWILEPGPLSYPRAWEPVLTWRRCGLPRPPAPGLASFQGEAGEAHPVEAGGSVGSQVCLGR